MKEIGSEFWLTNDTKFICDIGIPSWLTLGSDNKLLLSGRTAIDLVLKDILRDNSINNVYFPSYCCQSMLQPFIDNGINVCFYDVIFEEELIFNIDKTKECDIFFAMNYFGFEKGRMDRYIEIFKQRNIIVIEDSTHSLLSDKSFNTHSDYIVASLRKWFPVLSGGLAAKKNGRFNIQLKEETFKEMVAIRKSAMLDKAKYMNGDIYEKGEILEKYSIANGLLSMKYSLFSIDEESYRIIQSINVDFIIRKRKENVRFLYNNLQVSERFRLVFSEMDNGDCPIFLPVIFQSSTVRNTIRKHLINNNVYCPVHWPKPSILNEKEVPSIYDNELSLVTDQRYDDTDMHYLIRRLEEFYE